MELFWPSDEQARLPDVRNERSLEHLNRWECVTCGHEWERPPEAKTPAAARVVKDAHGNPLADGDVVMLIKDLSLPVTGGEARAKSKSACICN